MCRTYKPSDIITTKLTGPLTTSNLNKKKIFGNNHLCTIACNQRTSQWRSLGIRKLIQLIEVGISNSLTVKNVFKQNYKTVNRQNSESPN